MKTLITHKQIKKKIKKLAFEIGEEIPVDQPIVAVVVLNGAFMFASDLIKNLYHDCYVEFIKVSSYGDDTKSSGKVDLIAGFKNRPEYNNAHFLIIEDIVDTGRTVEFLKKHLNKEFSPKSIYVASLLWKDKGSKEPDFYCYQVDKKDFVVGRGLDYKGQYRNLINVYTLEQEDIND